MGLSDDKKFCLAIQNVSKGQDELNKRRQNFHPTSRKKIMKNNNM